MALGRRGLGRSAKARRTGGRQGEALRLADLGQIAPRRQRQAPGLRAPRGRRGGGGGGAHREKTEWGGVGPSQGRAQTPTAPARAKAATPGTILGRTR